MLSPMVVGSVVDWREVKGFGSGGPRKNDQFLVPESVSHCCPNR